MSDSRCYFCSERFDAPSGTGCRSPEEHRPSPALSAEGAPRVELPAEIEQALYEFESAVQSASHDMAGHMERAACSEARADLRSAIAKLRAERDAERTAGGVALLKQDTHIRQLKEALAAAEAALVGAREALAEVEWNGNPHGWTFPVCPACGGYSPGCGRFDAGHRPSCHLARALAPPSPEKPHQ